MVTRPWPGHSDLDGDPPFLDDIENRIAIALAEDGCAGIPGDGAGDLRDSNLVGSESRPCVKARSSSRVVEDK